MKKTIENHFAGTWETFYKPHLKKVKKGSGAQLTALCPFHDDTNPSFSFNGETGKWKCFAGCGGGNAFTFYAKKNNLEGPKNFPKVLKAIGDDFGISKVRVIPKIVEKYNYTNAAGDPVFRVCRTEPKSFFQQRPDGKGGWIKGIKGVERVLYNLPEVIKADEVLIVEGEKDVVNLKTIGLTGTTNPMGALKWKPEYNKYLKGKAVVLIPHNDDEGRKHMKQVADSLIGTAKSLKVLDLPDLPDKGDVSDFIEKHEDKDQAAETLAKMIEGAGPYKQRKSLPTRFTSAQLKTMEFPPPRWAVPDLLPEGCNMLGGNPKMGKSALCLNLGISVATGGLAFGKIPVEKGGVLYLALEDTGRRLHERHTKMLKGPQWPKNLHFDTKWEPIKDGEVPGLAKRIEEIPDLRLVIIDTLEIIRPEQTGRHKTQYTIDVQDVRVIKKLAEKYNISILIVLHFRKYKSGDIMADYSGTYGLTGAADGLLALERRYDQADAELHVTGRDIEAEIYALKFHSDIMSWELLGKAEEVKSTANRQLIYDTIKGADKPITPKEIKERTDIPDRTITQNLKELTRDGSIEKGIRYGSYKVRL